jgi:hypothetical protein
MTAAGGFDVETVQMVRLHVEAGRVWYGHDGFFAEDSGHSVEKFFARAPWLGVPLDKIELIRLLGVPENAHLIIRLHERRVARRQRQRIELGSPMLLPVARDRSNPVRVLEALYQPEAAPLACGGLHDMTVWDFPTYAMLAALQDSRPEVPEKAVKALPYHPAWPAISFLPYRSEEVAVRLLTEVVDPRWFRHPLRPHRINKLLNYLGVTPENMKALLEDGPPGRNYDRAELVVNTWMGPPILEQVGAPSNFLMRAYFSTDDRAAGLLRACRRFVRFVYEVWLGEAACRNRDCGFMATQFFKNKAEWTAYQSHRRSLG